MSNRIIFLKKYNWQQAGENNDIGSIGVVLRMIPLNF